MKYAIALLCCTVLTTPSMAQNIQDVFELSIRTGWREADGTHIAGVDIKLAPGWKTYWRQPGDAGIPPRFNWTDAENIAAADVSWPVPTVHWTSGMRSIGYENHVVLPLTITPRNAGPARLAGTIQLGVCEEICIPVEMRVDAILPPQGTFDPMLNAALKDQADVGTGTVTCAFSPTHDSMEVTVKFPKALQEKPDVVLEVAEKDLWIAEPKVTSEGEHWVATTEMLSPSGKPTAVARSGIWLTALYEQSAIEYRGCRAG